MRKLALLIIVLEGCASLPPFPSVYQCGYRHDRAAFYCVNTETKAQVKIPENSEVMKGAQCLSPNDFKAVENWVQTVEQEAQQHCH